MPSPSASTDPPRQHLPRRVVHRPHLEHRLDEVPPGGLGLLVASAGSGKSVLVRHWATTRPQVRVGTLALDRRHDDPVVLRHALVAAVAAVAPHLPPDLGQLVPGTEPGLGDALVDALRDQLAAVDDAVLVVEDAHAVSSRALLDDLGRLLTSLPPSARAVVTTRRDLPWSLHRLRLDDGLVELRGHDLAFAESEARALLELVSQRELSDAAVHTLTERTDGWAVGLQLAGISMRTTPDVSSFVDSFAGSDRLVSEYLVDEVIEQQEPDVRRFLLHTSVLDWLSADLCAAVTGMANAAALLEELYRRSMFLIPLDASGETFRYHHLFAEVLHLRLRIEDPGAVDELHHRAAHWLSQHGRPEEAIRHLLDAGDPGEAFRVISAVGHRLFERNEGARLVRWLSVIDEADPAGPATVPLSLLAAQLAADDAVGAAETYRRVCRRPDLTPGERAAADALYSLLVFRELPAETVLELSSAVREAVTHLAPDDVADFLGIGGLVSVQSIAEYTGSVAHFLSGDLDRAASTLEHVRSLPGMSYPVWHVYVLGSLALVRAWQGHSTEALGLARSALEEARSFGVVRHHAAVHAHFALALVHLDRLELDVAAQCLDEAGRQLRGRTASATYIDLHDGLAARLAAVQEGPASALARLHSPAAASAEAPLLREGRSAMLVRLLIGTGEVAGARAVLNGTRGRQVAPLRVDVALADGDITAAREAVDGWVPPQDDPRAHGRRLLREFCVLEAEGDRRAAAARLAEAVALTSRERLRWSFLEVPGALRAVRRGVVQAAWVSGDSVWDLAVRFQPSLRSQDGLVEPLTGRELALLAYLPGRMKNQEIAAELFLSVNTVKTPVASIYRTLGATDRDEAVARATDLGLL